MPKNRIDDFAQRLARFRRAKGLTQTDLANATKISRRMIAYYETRVKDIPPKKVVALSKALGVSVDELLGAIPAKETELIHSRRIAKKLKTVETLPKKDQKAVIDYIDMVAGLRQRGG